jgi:hypothetical protein
MFLLLQKYKAYYVLAVSIGAFKLINTKQIILLKGKGNINSFNYIEPIII